MTWETGWRYGIISTVPYEQQKMYRQIILFQRIYYLSSHVIVNRQYCFDVYE